MIETEVRLGAYFIISKEKYEAFQGRLEEIYDEEMVNFEDLGREMIGYVSHVENQLNINNGYQKIDLLKVNPKAEIETLYQLALKINPDFVKKEDIQYGLYVVQW